MASYKKGKKINSGGFGVVYRAVREEDNEIVALKELSNVDVWDDTEKQRFVREVKIQAKLDHKNVVPILGYNLAADPPWFVMPLAKCSLREQVDSLKDNTHRAVNVIVNDMDIKRLILARLLDMGHSHNRFHVGHVFATILKSIKLQDEALLAREVLKQNPRAAAWCADECKGGQVLPAILETLDECVAICSRPATSPSF